MKTIKIILGLVLSFAIIKSCNDLGKEEPRSETMYTIISLVFLLIPSYLFYSVIKNGAKKEEQNHSSVQRRENNELDKF